MKKVTGSLLIVFIASFILHADIWEEITATALAPNNDPTNGRALPLASTWDTGWAKYQWGDNRYGTVYQPSYIIDLITNNNRHLVAHINHLAPDYTNSNYNTYLSNAGALNYLNVKNQPITIGGIDNGCGGLAIWERCLYAREPYKSLPSATSPRVLDHGTQVLQDNLTPFPPVLSKWHDVGYYWIDSSIGMDTLQSLYPNPPKVIFLSDNEAEKLLWCEAETDQRYLNLYGTGQTNAFKRQKFADGWTSCYAEMFNGMRSGLNAYWQNNSIFIGYQAGGSWGLFGRQSNWQYWALFYDNKISWEQNAWDGDCMSYYAGDFQVLGVQVLAQNRVFMLADQLADNPDFWFELGVWNGGTSYSSTLSGIGQTMTGSRYKGSIQFGMWLLTPRVVRHFTLSVDRETEGFEYFDAVMDAVDRVHTDPVLKRFWQYGALVENVSHTHPLQIEIPTEFANRSRWFQLNTNLDPVRPWSLTTEIPVFAIARLIGTSPNREWLVYAHSPVQDRTGVIITLPGYGTVTTNVPREGIFVHVQETAAPTIPVMPVDQAADPQIGTIPATTATFSVKASGASLSYQWQKWNSSDWQNISGATNSSYVTAPVTQSDDGAQYRVIVSNSYGSNISATATLHVNFGCVGWWIFDEASGNAGDSSGNTNTGSLFNQAAFFSNGGVLNGAIALDGTDDYVKVSDVPALRYQGGELTLSTWVYINPTAVSGGYLISKPTDSSGHYNYSLTLSSTNYISFKLQSLNGYTTLYLTSPNALSASAWHHVAATVAPAGGTNYGMKLYIDGALVTFGVFSYSGSWSSSGMSLCLGQIYAQNYTNPAYSLDGKLDNVRIYTHALSPEAIAEQARCPVGRWKLDETSGAAADSSGNGNNGTLINNVQFVSNGGILNGAIALDGTDDYVKVSDVPALRYQGGELTLSTWVYINPTEVSGGYLFSKPTDSSGHFNYTLTLSSTNYILFKLQSVNGYTTLCLTSPNALSASAWHHVAATVAPAGGTNYSMKLYIDGALVTFGVFSYSGSWPSSGMSLCLGQIYAQNYTNPFLSLDGKLDEVRVYNRALPLDVIGWLAGK